MLAKNYHYDYYCIEALVDHNITTYDGRIIPGVKAGFVYPISNGKEVVDALVDMGASILTVLKNQGVNIREVREIEITENINKYMSQTLTNLRLQMILEDGYKCWFVQSNKGGLYFDLKQLSKFDPYQCKVNTLKPYMLGGVDLSIFAPKLWSPSWIPIINE